MAEKPPFRADHVGSLLRPQELKNAFRDFYSGKLDEGAFKDIQDRCIRDAVACKRAWPSVDHGRRVPARLMVLGIRGGGRRTDYQGCPIRLP